MMASDDLSQYLRDLQPDEELVPAVSKIWGEFGHTTTEEEEDKENMSDSVNVEKTGGEEDKTSPGTSRDLSMRLALDDSQAPETDMFQDEAENNDESIDCIPDSQPDHSKDQFDILKSQNILLNLDESGDDPNVSESQDKHSNYPVQVGDLTAGTELAISPKKHGAPGGQSEESLSVNVKTKLFANSSSSSSDIAVETAKSKVSGTEADTEDSETKKEDAMDDSDIQIVEASPQEKKLLEKTINLDESDPDESIKLELSFTDTQPAFRTNSESRGLKDDSKNDESAEQMSQILVDNKYLMQNIEDDEDMKEVSNILDNVVEEVSEADTPATQPMPADLDSTSAGVGDDKAGGKRKAGEAELSSGEEGLRKRPDVDEAKKPDLISSGSRPTPSCSSSQFTKLHEKSSGSRLADDEHEMTSLPQVDSRPSSSNDIQSPDISCSPIVGDEGECLSNGVHQRRTSTPGKGKEKGKLISSPQKQIRKKIKEREMEQLQSSEDEPLSQRRDRKKAKKEHDGFKEPSPVSSPEMASRLCEMVEEVDTDGVKAVLPPGFSLVTRVQVEVVGPSPLPEDVRAEVYSKLKLSDKKIPRLKRMSDVSFLSKSSSGGSSGYLGSGSSGVSGSSGGSQGRSRLSIMPELRVEPHRVAAPLPQRGTPDTVSLASSQESSMAVQVGSPERESREEEGELPPITEEQAAVAGPSGVKRKKSVTSSNEKSKNTPKKKLTRKKKKMTPSKDKDDSDDDGGSQPVSVQDKIPVAAEKLPEPTSGLGVGSRVFARWVDGTGVYFYSAIVVKEEEGRILVRFIEDGVERLLEREGEVVLTTQLSPGDQVTIKHDVYEAYEVTATLMSFPSRDSNGEIQYELNITPTDSEPGYNVDSRTVHHTQVSLSDQQASVVLSHLGLSSASNRVSADLNFGNLVFGKRRTRPSGSPATPTTRTTPARATPRRKRGGMHVEDSQHSHTETSAAEAGGSTTPRTKQRGAGIGRPRKPAPLSTTEDEAPPSASKRGSRQRERKSASLDEERIFLGMSFVLTQSLAPAETEDSEEEEEEDGTEVTFDKGTIKSCIAAGGGTVLPEFPTQHRPLPTADTELVVVTDRSSRTMTFLLALANSTPIVSFRYILDSTAAGKKLDYQANYLLPAGKSDLLQKEVEQGQDVSVELRAQGCLVPATPATSTRHRGSSTSRDTSGRKVLSGVNVLIISTNKLFTEDWQSVLDSLGASVTKRCSSSSRLSQVREPDVVVCDTTAPSAIVQDLAKKPQIPVVETRWVIECAIVNAKVGFDNFLSPLPTP